MDIMACYVDSELGNKVIEVATSYAKTLGANLHVVTSLPQKIERNLHDLSDREAAQKKLLEVQEKVKAQGVDCVVSLQTDDLSDGENLVSYAEQNPMEMVVVGVHRVSKVGKLIFGSTAQHVILSAPSYVLSVKV
ncbi:MAG: universal stress protein [Deltaproteobacteria bacterium]|nr:MAG: universal stress protein [Deltaproteobacteria bacterium]